MDVFLINAQGVVENIVVVPSLEAATAMYPGLTIVQRTADNAHLQIGDTP